MGPNRKGGLKATIISQPNLNIPIRNECPVCHWYRFLVLIIKARDHYTLPISSCETGWFSFNLQFVGWC